jgi:Arc/MetJ-type ribon-helix-helix transcriptional regulator
MKTISVNLPEAFVNGLEALVQRGLYANRSEAIRVAVRDLMKRELVEPIPIGQIEKATSFSIPPPPFNLNFSQSSPSQKSTGPRCEP